MEAVDKNLFNEQSMQINNEIKDYLITTAKWANFLAIVGYVGLSLLVIGGLSVGLVSSQFNSIADPSGILGWLPLLYLVMGVIYFFPVYYLHRFAQNIKRAFISNNESHLTEGMRYLKAHYRYAGICVIVVLAIYACLFLVMIAGLALR